MFRINHSKFLTTSVLTEVFSERKNLGEAQRSRLKFVVRWKRLDK